MWSRVITTKFEEVKQSSQVKIICSVCGKKRIRTITVCHTINPFNKNEDGTIRNYAQVSENVSKELKERVEKLKNKKDFICKTCKEKGEINAKQQNNNTTS